MSKRTRTEVRRHASYWVTPLRAVLPLLPHVEEWEQYFADPCAGTGDLIGHLEHVKFECAYRGDIVTGQDALEWRNPEKATAVITNPPWERQLLLPMIRHFAIELELPTWLLIDADFMHTKQASDLLHHCSDIVSVGRIRWIEGSAHDGMDNCAWYRFSKHNPQKAIFHARKTYL